MKGGMLLLKMQTQTLQFINKLLDYYHPLEKHNKSAKCHKYTLRSTATNNENLTGKNGVINNRFSKKNARMIEHNSLATP